MAQAKSYAAKLTDSPRLRDQRAGQSTAIDMATGRRRAGRSARISQSPEALWAQTFAVPNAWRDRFAADAQSPDKRRHLGRSASTQEIAVEPRAGEVSPNGEQRMRC